MSFFTVYGSMLALALIGFLLDSDFFFVATIGLCTAALFSMYGQMNAAAKLKMSAPAQSAQRKFIIFLFLSSIIGFVTAYIFFDNIGFSGFMLGLAATCAQFLISRGNW
ncbi:hypothetical protein ACFDR9_000962 [Janthinobacterium sp. CG_23.3]|uniref:hypothetical protein n=1 Tax=Janthinobacterium sp. CG_23.3 TaxID=3349634 RepID=UPI0038D35C30